MSYEDIPEAEGQRFVVEVLVRQLDRPRSPFWRDPFVADPPKPRKEIRAIHTLIGADGARKVAWDSGWVLE